MKFKKSSCHDLREKFLSHGAVMLAAFCKRNIVLSLPERPVKKVNCIN